MFEYSLERKALFSRFIRYRETSNAWNDSYAKTLLYFDRFCSDKFPGVSGITQEMVDGWCRQRDTESHLSRICRCQSMITLIQFLRERGLTEVSIPELPKCKPRGYIPHAFTDGELACFFDLCDSNVISARNPIQAIRALVVAVLFRLLYSSGIRTTEARLLLVKNIDLGQGILSIKDTKGHNQHYVVLHGSMLQLLLRYDESASSHYPDRKYFFPMNIGDKAFSADMLDYEFHKVWDRMSSAKAVPYNLRHHYAIQNINSWLDVGFDFHDKLLYLSKSMGHSSLESTKYYYSLVPSLANVIYEKTNEGFDGIVPEVADYE